MRQPVHKDITFHHPTAPFYFIANIVLADFSIANGATEFWLGSHAHTSSADQIPCTEETKVRKQVPGDPSCNVKLDVVEERRKVRPPIQATCQKGDIMIRDLRTWHAGMPNMSEDDRIMIAVGCQVSFINLHVLGGQPKDTYNRLAELHLQYSLCSRRSTDTHKQQSPWYQNNTQRLYLPLESANFFNYHGGQPVEIRADFLREDEMQQLWRNYDFTFEPSVAPDRRVQAKL
jgi:ectoine hydroxylase-related dioxygenase (phytanoyl-CoA dioxygenase family)